MLVVSVISLKGGVGKTSVTLGLAGAAWERGLQALVVDLDPQANATLALDPAKIGYTTNDILADARAGVLLDAIVVSGWGEGVDVVAAEAGLELRNTPERDGALRLRKAMRGVEDRDYDLVLVDSPPSLGELTRNALTASHRALVVTEPSLFAVRAAAAALEAIEVVRASNNLRLRPAGVVVNRVRPGRGEHEFRLAELTDAYGDLVLTPPLPERTAIAQSEGACVPVQRWRTPGAREVAAIFDTYLDHVLRTDPADGPLSTSGRRR
jgi:cellulose biosynthesis protein BcsQ